MALVLAPWFRFVTGSAKVSFFLIFLAHQRLKRALCSFRTRGTCKWVSKVSLCFFMVLDNRALTCEI
jgi:hypothetical protein